MIKKIIVWFIVFILIPVCLVAIVYGIYSQRWDLKSVDKSVSFNPAKGISLLMWWIEHPVTAIKELSWATLKVPLFDTVTIPFSDRNMSFTFENKAYTITPTAQYIRSPDILLVPLEVTEEEGQTYNLITAYEKNGNTWTQKQSVFLWNKVHYNSIEFWSGILSVDFSFPWEEKIEIDDSATQIKRYFKVKNWHIAPYYPNINNGLIKDMAIIQNNWIWKETRKLDNFKITPVKEGIFSIRMGEEWKFTATTDCNNVMGNFVMNDVTLSYSDFSMTRMACEWKTQQDVFIELLKNVKTYDYKNNQFILIDSNGSKTIFEKMKK